MYFFFSYEISQLLQAATKLLHNTYRSQIFTVEILPNCYLRSLFLNIQNVCQSCLETSDSIRHYQQHFPKAYFAFLLPKKLHLRLYLSNHLGLSHATNESTTDCIWVERYFKKSFWHANNFQKPNGIRQSPSLLYLCTTDSDTYCTYIRYVVAWMYLYSAP